MLSLSLPQFLGMAFLGANHVHCVSLAYLQEGYLWAQLECQHFTTTTTSIDATVTIVTAATTINATTTDVAITVHMAKLAWM